MGSIVENGTRVESTNGEHYRIIQFLGAGGNCQVYLAMSTRGQWQGILFAIKFFTKIDDGDRLSQFKLERMFLLETTHPSIMKIYSEGEHYITSINRKLPFVVCDYFPQRLDYKIKDSKLRLSEKLIYILQLLSALQYLENRTAPIVHRDIKPQNIFIKGYTCVMGDFGLMKELNTSTEVIENSEQPDFFKNSAGPGMPKFYRTPDLVKYAKQEAILTTASDVFQLGLVAAEMFTGRNPLKKSESMLEDVQLADLAEIKGQDGNLIKDIIQKMLVKDPLYRGKIPELLDDFDGVLRAATTKQIEIDGFAF